MTYSKKESYRDADLDSQISSHWNEFSGTRTQCMHIPSSAEFAVNLIRYIFQELGTAGDLWTYVDMTGPVDEVEAALYIYQILLALNFIHSQNIVHCDVKPENILMMSSNSGRVVLTDFGCAQMLDSASGRLHSCKGTLEYRAP